LRGAIKECENFLAIYPDVVPFQNRLAWLYGQKKVNLEKAIELSKKTLLANPKSPDYLDTLSSIYFAKGDKQKAIEYIQKAIELSPESVYYKNQLKKFQS
jgi:tetratricopeptide (TPR) repeat protein